MTEIVVRSPSGSLPRLFLYGMEEYFDDDSLLRGAVHAVRGHVDSLVWDEGRAALTGTVRVTNAGGHAGTSECRVLVQFSPAPGTTGSDALDLEYDLTGSICTCRMGEACEHAAGLLHSFDIIERQIELDRETSRSAVGATNESAPAFASSCPGDHPDESGGRYPLAPPSPY